MTSFIEPMVPELVLRPVTWPEDAPILVEINNAHRAAGGSISVTTRDTLRASYDHLVHCDLGTDLVIAEAGGQPVAYGRVEWSDETRGGRVHHSAIFWTPGAPERTFEVLVDWATARHRATAAAERARDRSHYSSVTVFTDDPATGAALKARGFAPVRFGFEMLRPTLDEIPDIPLPVGLEVRTVERAHLHTIWEAEADAFAGHWGASADDRSETRWQEFLADPFVDTSLWQVAWDGDRVAGMVRPFINDEENARFDGRRGWCENISTRAEWRGRGVASALICRALRALRDRGMTESALGVDAQNETGALRLYRKMGFREVSQETEWRRPLGASPATGRAAGDGIVGDGIAGPALVPESRDVSR